MARASSKNVIVLGKRRRKRLERIVARASSPQQLVLRARIVLAAWRRDTNAKIARDLGVVCGHRAHLAGPVPPGRDTRPCSIGPVPVAHRCTKSRPSC